MSSDSQHYEHEALTEGHIDTPPSMVGPLLGMATTLCLVAASWVNDIEQIMRITASFLGCMTSVVTIRAIIKRSKKNGNGLL